MTVTWASCDLVGRRPWHALPCRLLVSAAVGGRLVAPAATRMRAPAPRESTARPTRRCFAPAAPGPPAAADSFFDCSVPACCAGAACLPQGSKMSAAATHAESLNRTIAYFCSPPPARPTPPPTPPVAAAVAPAVSPFRARGRSPSRITPGQSRPGSVTASTGSRPVSRPDSRFLGEV